jgi:hypothetical protein
MNQIDNFSNPTARNGQFARGYRMWEKANVGLTRRDRIGPSVDGWRYLT